MRSPPPPNIQPDSLLNHLKLWTLLEEHECKLWMECVMLSCHCRLLLFGCCLKHTALETRFSSWGDKAWRSTLLCTEHLEKSLEQWLDVNVVMSLRRSPLAHTHLCVYLWPCFHVILQVWWTKIMFSLKIKGFTGIKVSEVGTTAAKIRTFSNAGDENVSCKAENTQNKHTGGLYQSGQSCFTTTQEVLQPFSFFTSWGDQTGTNKLNWMCKIGHVPPWKGQTGKLGSGVCSGEGSEVREWKQNNLPACSYSGGGGSYKMLQCLSSWKNIRMSPNSLISASLMFLLAPH